MSRCVPGAEIARRSERGAAAPGGRFHPYAFTRLARGGEPLKPHAPATTTPNGQAFGPIPGRRAPFCGTLHLTRLSSYLAETPTFSETPEASRGSFYLDSFLAPAYDSDLFFASHAECGWSAVG
jgi:hypothetical protein